ncbi:SusD/RagB family nutrient-binding outer membrane lipoprotein [Algivirga pacifica]|uniref:SusD/RagB family nutrient-binding outer membrane lipoprotein n=1 Tax=Algivirga pacifica TaxID=1162670 RepID=A0ABP9DEP2_9BACT
MRKITIYITSLLLLIQGGSCSSDWFDINQNPNAAQSSTIQLTLPAGIAGVAYVFGGKFQVLGGLWGQYWTQSPGAQQYRDLDQYKVSPGEFSRMWQIMYTGADRGSVNLQGSGALKDLTAVQRMAREQENWTYYLIATTMKVYGFQMMADLYNDIPYTEALKGLEVAAPIFDEGPLVYDSLINELDFALGQDLTIKDPTAELGPEEVGTEDFVFAGDMDQWVRFANTLKLKIYLRQVNARPEVTQAGVQELFSNGAEFLVEESAAMTQFNDAASQRNPLYETEVTFLGNTSLIASNTSLQYLLDNNDPRIDEFYELSRSDNAYIGLDQGTLFGDGNSDNYSRVDLGPVKPVYFMTVAEAYFLLAEAALRYPAAVGETPQVFYDAGVTASFERLELLEDDMPPVQVADGGVYAYPTTGDFETQLEAIITQKWVELNGIGGPEGFFEFNRTGYPSFFVESANPFVNGIGFPQRIPYDNEEAQVNPNAPSYNELEVRNGVWWSLKATGN